MRENPTQGIPANSPGINAKQLHRAVLKESIQHPSTIFPLAISAVSAMFMALIHFEPVSFSVGVGSFLLGAASLVGHYFFRFEHHARKVLQRRQRSQSKQQAHAAKQLEQDCVAAGFPQGAKEARELRMAYSKLLAVLQTPGEPSLQTQRFHVLAEDSYADGLRMIRSALDTFRVLRTMDQAKLQMELTEFMAEARRLRKHGDLHATRLEALNTMMQSHQARLDSCRRQQDLIQQFLAQSETIEAALETAMLEMGEWRTRGELPTRGDTAGRLEQAVQAARQVEERLRNLGADPADDAVYLEASKKKSTPET